MTRVQIHDATETPGRPREPGGLSSLTDRIRATYDAAQTTTENANHWLAADGLSATAANSEAVRTKLRRRSRYEIANNSYAKGAVDTIVNDTIGTGPRHQIRSGSVRTDTDRAIEEEFGLFMESINIAEKLRTLKKGHIGSGEAFALFTRGAARPMPGMGLFDPRSQVELGLHVIEADQVATPELYDDATSGLVSGIEHDEYGNPVAYHVLRSHPGDTGGSLNFTNEYRRVPADLVCHYFTPERPGDARGIPLFTPALGLFAVLRRYTMAILHSAELVSSIAGMLKTNASADSETQELATLDVINFVRGMIQVLPEGWDFTQPRSEQPTTTYPEFTRQILREIARSVGLPYNIFAGDSSDHNYASGRLDHLGYGKLIKVDRSQLVARVLNPLFLAWFDEASRISGYLPEEARTIDYRRSVGVSWFFDGTGHVDPVKEATGQKIRLENGATSIQIEAANAGHDWRELLEHQAAENKLREELGLPLRGAGETSRETQEVNDDD